MGSALRPSGFFAFRAPALPLSTLVDWADGVQAPTAAPGDLAAALERDRALLRGRLAALAQRPEIADAVALASPDLMDAVRHRPDDPGTIAAFVRYLARMAARCTPFGAFAGCGVGVVGDRLAVRLAAPDSWQQHRRLDGDYLDALARSRVEALRPRITVRPNDSLHADVGRWRYVSTRPDGDERSFTLVEVADSDHLRRALDACRHGAPLDAVVDAVVGGGVERDRAARYVDQLLDAQVVVAELAVRVTGGDPAATLADDLEALGDAETAATVRSLADDPSVSARSIQVDTVTPADEAVLPRAAVDEIARAVEVLRRIAPVPAATAFDRFKEAFAERYEEAEVPLLDALDEETGIGFGADADPAPLLRDLRLPPSPKPSVAYGAREETLLALLHRAWATGALEVTLGPDDVEAMARPDALPLPAALAAVVVPARVDGGVQYVLHAAVGPSGARLLGRFCHADPALEAHVRAHVADEEALDPDAVFAEIVHLPSGRMLNVSARPVLRAYEVEWLGRSGAPPERRLAAADLLLSLRGGRFVLRSRSLDCRVVPRLTNAHNVHRRSPGVYRFLAALQADGVAEWTNWSWQPFGGAPFTPRVRWGQVVLARARWSATGGELQALDGWEAVQAWRAERRLPRWACLIEGDNVLPFDLDNALSVDVLVRAARRRATATFEELFPGPDELVATAADGDRAVELVIPLVQSQPVVPAPVSRPAAPVRRVFPPGSEWSYVKLHTGPATADRLLRDHVRPFVRDLMTSGQADCWFFVRYDNQLRVRARGASLEPLATRAVEEGLASDAEVATYRREVERYGGPEGIAIAEQVFHADSDAAVDLLALFEPGAPGHDARWRIGVFGTDMLLRDFGLDAAARTRFARRMEKAFEHEFRADAALRTAVSARARAERNAVTLLLAATPDSEHALAPGIAVVAERSSRIAPLAAQLHALGAPVEQLAESFVHMWLDRLCRSQNRFHEYVTYALLARMARNTSTPPKTGSY
ncbi:MAG TPA: lantibiotic dehydratase [Acidimicrobiales bacterium]|nr:lantibiotic dehydratase [Acidimicrobiales bacterium]